MKITSRYKTEITILFNYQTCYIVSLIVVFVFRELYLRVVLVTRLDKALPKQKLFRRALLNITFLHLFSRFVFGSCCIFELSQLKIIDAGKNCSFLNFFN
jgi:hypothetical protein